MQRRHFLQQALSLPLLSIELTAAEIDADVAIIGGGVGGCAAALAALRKGLRVVLTEETDWIGGQLTSQAVPPDEHPWIERFGCTRSYREYRNAVRQYYRDHYPLTAAARARVELNPGNGSVSRLAHEPRVSLAVLEAMLTPFVKSGRLTLLTLHRPERASISGDRVTGVTLRDLQHGRDRAITAKYFLDATELGDLLPLTKTEFVTGAESQAQTGEAHAASTAQPGNNQSFTFCFGMDYLPGEDHTIEKPRDYAKWQAYVPQLTPPWTGPLLSWKMCEPKTLQPRDVFFDPNPPEKPRQKGMNLWTYRRILARDNCLPGKYPSDVSLVNWPQNDFWLGDLLTAAPAQKESYLKDAKQLSLSLLYWMQTQGWKGLRLRKDVTGTENGLAKAAYIRESRRIQGEFTILEQHVAKVPASFADSVGVGCYRIDLHPTAAGVNYIDIGCFPFQIPLGALIPKRMENLLPACKNLGTTHITNGCYRLHPVEWNIGEAAGALAAHAIQKGTLPRAIRNDPKLLADFQSSLHAQGFELAWPLDQIHAV
jgi:hypothetical protein